jgi:hypothetical protein
MTIAALEWQEWKERAVLHGRTMVLTWAGRWWLMPWQPSSRKIRVAILELEREP